jgi:hypothetical protein
LKVANTSVLFHLRKVEQCAFLVFQEIRSISQCSCQIVEHRLKNRLLPSKLQSVKQVYERQIIMSNNNNPLTLPTREPRRTKTLNMRLSEAERTAVDRLAEVQGVSASTLARHFLLQAVAYYNRKMQAGEAADEQSE